MTTLKNIDVKEAARIICEQAPFILDVRTTGEYQSGHIVDSILIPLQDLESRVRELPQDQGRAIVVYCRSGNRSSTAGDMLTRLRFSNVYNVLGGIYFKGKVRRAAGQVTRFVWLNLYKSQPPLASINALPTCIQYI